MGKQGQSGLPDDMINGGNEEETNKEHQAKGEDIRKARREKYYQKHSSIARNRKIETIRYNVEKNVKEQKTRANNLNSPLNDKDKPLEVLQKEKIAAEKKKKDSEHVWAEIKDANKLLTNLNNQTYQRLAAQREKYKENAAIKKELKKKEKEKEKELKKQEKEKEKELKKQEKELKKQEKEKEKEIKETKKKETKEKNNKVD